MAKLAGPAAVLTIELERGDGSFTAAEQFLKILALFNVPATHFVTQ